MVMVLLVGKLLTDRVAPVRSTVYLNVYHHFASIATHCRRDRVFPKEYPMFMPSVPSTWSQCRWAVREFEREHATVWFHAVEYMVPHGAV